MRLWSFHPRYLDSKGLVALWREALLAQAVLNGQTRGYRHHPQLTRFRQHHNPRGAIATYLRGVHAEAERRGYSFDKTRILSARIRTPIPVTRDQLRFEFAHLQRKLKQRDQNAYRDIKDSARLIPHPLFKVRKGPIEKWENVPPG
jgi:hypothetical protein